MICPNCEWNDIPPNTKICPQCGLNLPLERHLTETEKRFILEKSILKGQIAELQSREKRHLERISRLKTYTVLLVCLLPMATCVCTKKTPAPTLSGVSGELLYHLTKPQLIALENTIQLLSAPADATFSYVVKQGDYPENISLLFYHTPIFADTILMDNGIFNSRRIAVGDTILLRVYPQKPRAKKRF